MTDKLPACSECVHRRLWYSYDAADYHYACTHPDRGMSAVVDVSEVRGDESKCGREGRWWAPR